MISLEETIKKIPLSKYEQIVFYILRHTDGGTQIFNRSYNQIQKDLHVTAKSVSHVFTTLEENGTLIRIGIGKWKVPAVVGYEQDEEESLWALKVSNE